MLHELGWHDFQQLCHTVLREVLGQTVVSFLDNPDAGRDGAFAGTWARKLTAIHSQGSSCFSAPTLPLPAPRLLSVTSPMRWRRLSDLLRRDGATFDALITNARVTGNSELAITAAFR